MTDTNDTIVARLRRIFDESGFKHCKEAANVIEQQQQRIAELEAALRHLGDEEAFPLSNDSAKTAFEALGDSYYARIEYARAALEDKE